MEKKNRCSPTIYDNTLMSDEWEFINREFVIKKCKCDLMNICISISNKFDEYNLKWANDLYDEYLLWKK